MDPLSAALSAVEAVLIFAGLGIRFLVRNRRSDAADPVHAVDGANQQLQETDGESGPPANTEPVARGHNSQNLSFPRSISALRGHEFEVFLSFRGADIRKSFADCLYHYLTNLGVRTFRDSEELHVGREIGPDLRKAIEQSKIFVPIFTRDYASSKWCLREVAEAVKWMEEDVSSSQQGIIIMPIFFDVKPDEVQHQNGSYARAFAQHEKKFDPETVRGWRNALKEVTKLKGLELTQAANGNQGEFIKLVVDEVLRELRQPLLDVSEILVGIEDPAEEVLQMLEINLNDIRMVGMWGTGGIGKTTLAKYVYNRVAEHFECRSSLSDVRETSGTPGGLLELQRKLVSDMLGQQQKYHLASTDDGINVLKTRVRGKRALILLDDVDNIHQVKALAAEPSWFGSGSRILVTTRDKAVLDQFPWCKTYELKLLGDDLALELFCKYAFQDNLCPTEFVDLSRDVVRMTGRLPLALTVIGSLLFANRGKKGVWDDTIEQLKRRPETDVHGKLKISYDALDAEQKEIFLDIACFFIYADYETLIPLWDDCKFFPRRGIEVLRLKSLIKIRDDNRIEMHDQLRDLGRHIVDQENLKEPEQRSRLWRREEAVNVITRQQGTSKIEGAVIWPKEEGVIFDEKCFQYLSKLRILRVVGDVKFAGDYQHLLPELRWLRWMTKSKYPPNLAFNNLVVLDLSSSWVDEEWIGWNSTEMGRLRVLTLSGNRRLRRIPGFSSFPNLERLILEGCGHLVSIDPSIGLLKSLNCLNLRNCQNLKKLPHELGHLEALAELIVDSTSVEEIPISTRMKKLEFLSANNCFRLKYIPESVGSLVNLKRLSLEDCSSLRELPETIGQLKSLIELRLQNSGITCLPKALENLKELQVLDARGCCSLKGEVPVDIGSLSHVRVLTLCLTKDTILPPSLSGLPHLQNLHLYLGRCWNHQTLPELPSNLVSLTVEGSLPHVVPARTRRVKWREGIKYLTKGEEEMDFCGDHMKLKKECLAQLCRLEKLILRSVNIDALPKEIGSFPRLKTIAIKQCSKLACLPTLPPNLCSLEVYDCCNLRKLPSLSNLRKLSKLSIRDCPLSMLKGVERLVSLRELCLTSCDFQRQLVDAQGINNLTELELIDFSNCTSLETLSDLSKLQRLQRLQLASCEMLSQLGGLEKLESLWMLCIGGCKAIEKLPDLSKLQNLSYLDVTQCEKLRLVEGIGELASLTYLSISGCKAIEKLPDLSKLQNLSYLDVTGCEKLRLVEGIGELASLRNLTISGCKAIEKLPDLSKLQNLSSLNVTGCEKLRFIEGIGELASLMNLNISGCKAIEELPNLSKLQNLYRLSVRECENLCELDSIRDLGSLEYLDISGCKAIEKLPELSKLQHLRELHMRDCEKLRRLDSFTESNNLEELDITRCKAIERLSDLSKLKLRKLEIGEWKKNDQIDGLEELEYLEELALSSSKSIEELPNLSKLSRLVVLNIRDCEHLCELEMLGKLRSLKSLEISRCKAIKKLSELSKLQNLRYLRIAFCAKLGQLDEIGELLLLEKLEIAGCKAIEKLLDLSKLQNLQHMKMTGCNKLSQVDGIGELVSLKQLDIIECKSIRKLPKLSKLRSLKHLNMRGCEKLNQIDGIKELGSLEELDISYCKAIEKLPELSRLLTLRRLNMRDCEKLNQIDGIVELLSVKQLDLSECKALEKLPNLSKQQSLWHLNVRSCGKLGRVDGLEELHMVEELSLSGFKSTENIPDLSKLQRLRWLRVEACEELHKLGLEKLEWLEHLEISKCGAIKELPDLSNLQRLYSLQVKAGKNLHQLDRLKELESLLKLDVSGSKAIEKLPKMSKQCNLLVLHMRGCSKLRQLDVLGELGSLEELDISGCIAIENLPDLAKLKRLRMLKVSACKKLRCLDGLEGLNLLEELDISGCNAIEQLPDLSQLHRLQDLRMEGCEKLLQLDGLGLEECKSLRVLRISGCKRIEKLPNLSKLQNLWRLDIRACKQLRGFEGLEELKLLWELNISGCRALEKLADLSKLGRLGKLKMKGCKNIREVQGLEKLRNLKELCISGCKSLNLPDLSHLPSLQIKR